MLWSFTIGDIGFIMWVKDGNVLHAYQVPHASSSSHEAPLDYHRAKEIRDVLAAKGERTLFGGMTGAAATWDRIVKAYENGGGESLLCGSYI